MQRFFTLFICAAVLLAPASYLTAQTTVILNAQKDNTLYQSATGALSNALGSYFFAGNTNTGDIRRGVIAFDLSSIPANATITSAKLKLNMSKSISGAANVSLHKVAQNWGEGTSNAANNEGGGTAATPGDATWLHPFFNTTTWTTVGGDYAATPSATLSVNAVGSYTWNTSAMAADVQSWLANPATNFGWILIGDEVSSPSAKRFDTKDNANATVRPQLEISYTVPSVVAPKIVITEISYNDPNSGNDSLEYIELYNNELVSVNLAGFSFSAGVTYTFPAMMMPAGSRLVVAFNAAAMQSKFGFTPLQWTSGNLSNSGELIKLVTATGLTVDSVNYDDAAPWPTTPDGNGPSLELCDVNADNANAANWIASLTPAGFAINNIAVYASPNAANNCNPVVNPTNLYPLRTIAEMTNEDANGVADSLNKQCELRGIVYGIDFDGNAGYSFTLIDQTGGINVFKSTDLGTFAAVEGDSIHVKGKILQYNGLTEIEPDSVFVKATALPLQMPLLTDTLDETTESRLVLMTTMSLVNPAQWPASGASANVDITDGTDVFVMRIDADTDIDGTPAPLGVFDVIGIGGQFDGTNPYTSGYQLFPSRLADIMVFPSASVVAFDDYYLTSVDLPVSMFPLYNAITPNPITAFTLVTNPLNGTITVTATDTTYTPNAGFCGIDSFTYQVCDAFGCDTATIFIDVLCPLYYPYYPVSQVTQETASDGIADSIGIICELRGVVYGVNLRPSGLQFYLSDATGGINVFSFDPVSNYTVTEGDSIHIWGMIDQFNGLTEIVPDSILLISQNNPTPIRAITTPAEAWESTLIKAMAYSIIDPAEWTNSGTGFNVRFTNGSDTIVVRIDNDVNLFGTPAPVGAVNITGIVTQFDNTLPYTSGYQLMPRYTADIEPYVNTTAPNLSANVQLFPNPVSDYLTITTDVPVTVIRIVNAVGQTTHTIHNPQPTERIETTLLPSGVYTATFTTPQGVWTQLFLKN